MDPIKIHNLHADKYWTRPKQVYQVLIREGWWWRWWCDYDLHADNFTM